MSSRAHLLAACALAGLSCKEAAPPAANAVPTSPGASAAPAAEPAAPEPALGQAAKACCMGRNPCKGRGGCAVPESHDCAGKNACEGRGGCNAHCPR